MIVDLPQVALVVLAVVLEPLTAVLVAEAAQTLLLVDLLVKTLLVLDGATQVETV